MSATDREAFGRRCDVLMHGGVILLLAFAPLPFGSVHAWAQATVQVLIAALVIVWGVKLLRRGTTTEATDRMRRWAPPLLVFGAVALVQLAPLPPAVLRILSPNTYAIYRDTLPGWPDGPPDAALPELVDTLQSDARRPLPAAQPATVRAADRWAASNAEVIREVSALAGELAPPQRWRPLSLYRYRDGEELLRMLAYSTLFFCSSPTRGNHLGVRLSAAS
jgi:hypothetical protein